MLGHSVYWPRKEISVGQVDAGLNKFEVESPQFQDSFPTTLQLQKTMEYMAVTRAENGFPTSQIIGSQRTHTSSPQSQNLEPASQWTSMARLCPEKEHS